MNSRYVLLGVTKYIVDETDYCLITAEDRDVVAVFTSREKAEEYVEKSKSSFYTEEPCWRHANSQFRRDSLLRGYVSAEVKGLCDKNIDPLLPEKRKQLK